MSDRWAELNAEYINVHVRVDRWRDGVWMATVWHSLPYDEDYSGDATSDGVPNTPVSRGPTASAAVKSLMRVLGVES